MFRIIWNRLNALRPHRAAAVYERDICAISAGCNQLDAQWRLREAWQNRLTHIRRGRAILNG